MGGNVQGYGVIRRAAMPLASHQAASRRAGGGAAPADRRAACDGLAIDRERFDQADYRRFERAAGGMPARAGAAAGAARLRDRPGHHRGRAGAVPGRRPGPRPAAEPGGPGRDGRPAGGPGDRPLQPGAQPHPGAAGRPALRRLGQRAGPGARRSCAGPPPGTAAGWPWSASSPPCAPRTCSWPPSRTRPATGPSTTACAGCARSRSRSGSTGTDPLELAADDIGLEGANTSFQVHLRVDPDRFAAHFNAAQLATAPVLAVAGNSPTFLGHRLWEETRVALFKQAVDDRDAAGRSSRRSPGSPSEPAGSPPAPMELLEESVRLHEPVLPVLGAERPAGPAGRRRGAPPWTSCACTRARCGAGTGPSTTRLAAATCGSRLRALPAGPTVVDMLANAAFLLGLTLALAPDADAWIRRVAVPAGPPQLLPTPPSSASGPSWPGRGAGGRVRDGPGGRADPAAAAGRPPGAGGGRGASPRRSTAARRHRRPRRRRPDRRRLAAPHPGRPGTAAGPRASASGMLERYLEHQRTGDPVHTWPIPVAQRSG